MLGGVDGGFNGLPSFAFAGRLVAVALALAIASTGFAEAQPLKCETEPLRINRASMAVVTHWRVTKGEICGVSFGSGYSGNVDNFVISQKPAHGVAGVNNGIAQHAIGYRPANGYVGPDHFQVTLRANDSRQNYSFELTVDVDVVVVDKL